MLRSSRPVVPLLASIFLISPAARAVSPRLQVAQHGDFVLIGNTLAQDCGTGTPSPVVGTKGGCGTNSTDLGADVYWLSESPGPGQASCSTATTVASQARSTAILSLPAGASVTHAYVYWAATFVPITPDLSVTFERPGGFSTVLNAATSFNTSNIIAGYQSVADVTALVQAQGAGAYRMTGVNSTALVNTLDANAFVGWWMVVVYSLGTDPVRAIGIYDGLDSVTGVGTQSSATLSGFMVPPTPSTSRLAAIGFGGDASISGDQISLGGSPLTNALNPATNFFNSTHSSLGTPVSTTGDLPQTNGNSGSMSGIDLDIVNISSSLTPGATTLSMLASSTNDNFLLGGIVTSIPTTLANLTDTLTVTDLNGGAVVPGDTLAYTLTVTNTGDDTAKQVYVDHIIPVGASYVPGTLNITSGANLGLKTDAIGDDQAEYKSAFQKSCFLLGAGATGLGGGTLAPAASTTATFRVTVTGSPGSTLSLQGNISYTSQGSQIPGVGVSDGDLTAPGDQATTVLIEACSDDSQCSAPTPHCNTNPSPNVCVQCLVDNDCGGSNLVCNLSGQCICSPSIEVCDGVDNDCNGSVDDGLGTMGPCFAGQGACQSPGQIVCAGMSGFVCDAQALPPSAEICGNGIDENCNGVPDEGCAGVDSDGDGLTDADEAVLMTNPNDADSDDDGVPDGMEIDPGIDSNNDGTINALDPDSDGDGLFDGTEMGLDCSNPGTNLSAGFCIPDGDGGATTTSTILADTDLGGVSDGVEDSNHNGVVDPGERNPRDTNDDGECQIDGDCGMIDSARVCDVAGGFVCIDGCRGLGGNMCPAGQVCTSFDETIGQCTGGTGGTAGASGTGGMGGAGGFAFPDIWGLTQQEGGAAGFAGGFAATAGASSSRPAATPITPASANDPNGCTFAPGVTASTSRGLGWFAGLVALAGLAGRRRRR